MRLVVALREGVPISLEDVFPSFDTPFALEHLRREVARAGVRLQRELALREPALAVQESSSGPVITARGVAGTVRICGTEVDIAPKYVVNQDDNWRANLVFMLERAAGRRSSFTSSRRLQLKQRTFIDQFAYGFALELQKATQGPPIVTYRSTKRDLPHLRGRLLVSEQLKSALTRPHRIICEVDALDTNNPTNRLIHWAARRLTSMATDPKVQRFLSEQANRLPPVSEPLQPPVPLVAAIPRQFRHYDSVLEMALALARGQTTFPGISDLGGAGFLIATERLFESFIERSLAQILTERSSKWAVRAQAREVFAIPIGTGREYYSKPDNVVDFQGDPRIIIDAKYKKFAEATEEGAGDRPTNADLYQMVAACVAHGTNQALLVYPRIQDGPDAADLDPSVARWWTVSVSPSVAILIGALSVDLSRLDSPSGLRAFDAELGDTLAHIASSPQRPTVETMEMRVARV